MPLNSLKIGIITPRYPPNTQGGGEISTELLAQQLSQRTQHKVVVHSFDGSVNEVVNGIQVFRHADLPSVPEISSLQSIKYLKDEMKSIDVLHGYNMELHPAVGLLSYITSTHSVAHLNSYTYINKRKLGMELKGEEWVYNNLVRPITKPVVSRAISKINTLIALSDSIKEIYEAEDGFNSPIRKVTNMIDPSFTPGSINYDLTTPPELLYVGALNIHKGVKYLIRSIQYLDRDVHLSIVGDGPEFQGLQSLITNLNLDDQIDLLGQVPHHEVQAYYDQSDIFVHPGIWPEPLNRTILEAMQFGLTVVATDIGGPRDVISDSQLLCNPGDPSELSKAIEYGIRNRVKIGREQHDYITDNNHPQKVIEEIDKIYNTII